MSLIQRKLVLGIDLLAFVRGEEKLPKLAIWMAGWLLIGLLGIAVMPLVRSLLVTPFVLLMAGVWAVIGLVFWLPRFTFASLDAAASSFLFMMTGGRSRNPVMILTRAFLYYFDGFNIIFSILTNTTIVRTTRSKEDINKETEQMFRSLMASFLYLLIYLPLWMLLSWPWMPTQ